MCGRSSLLMIPFGYVIPDAAACRDLAAMPPFRNASGRRTCIATMGCLWRPCRQQLVCGRSAASHFYLMRAVAASVDYPPGGGRDPFSSSMFIFAARSRLLGEAAQKPEDTAKTLPRSEGTPTISASRPFAQSGWKKALAK